jgi:hypothetical protein
MEVFNTDKFICKIQNCPELWNTCAREYADKSKRETARRMVLTFLYGEEEVKKWEVDKRSALGVDSASKNEYQDTPGGFGGRCVSLTTYHLLVPLSRNLGTLTSWNLLGLSRPVTGQLYNS